MCDDVELEFSLIYVQIVFLVCSFFVEKVQRQKHSKKTEEEKGPGGMNDDWMEGVVSNQEVLSSGCQWKIVLTLWNLHLFVQGFCMVVNWVWHGGELVVAYK